MKQLYRLLFLQMVSSNQPLVVSKQGSKLFEWYRTRCRFSPMVAECQSCLFVHHQESCLVRSINRFITKYIIGTRMCECCPLVEIVSPTKLDARLINSLSSGSLTIGTPLPKSETEIPNLLCNSETTDCSLWSSC